MHSGKKVKIKTGGSMVDNKVQEDMVSTASST